MTIELRCSFCGSPYKGERRTAGNGPNVCGACRGDVVTPASERYDPTPKLGPSEGEVRAILEDRRARIDDGIQRLLDRRVKTTPVPGRPRFESRQDREHRAGDRSADGSAYWVVYENAPGGRWVTSGTFGVYGNA
jgi:hypothetical protein